MDLKRRIAKLERQLNSDPVVLHFADGSVALIPSRAGGDHLLELLASAVSDERTSEINLIARSVRLDEPGDSKICELIRAVVNSPQVPAFDQD